MSESTSPPTESRVVITIDSDHFSDTTIDYAVRVAAYLKRPLYGVFVEDTDLLRSAELPFTTEICLTTGQPRQFDTESLTSAFRTITSRFRERLAKRAESGAVRWSVNSIRGRHRDYRFDHFTATDCCIYESRRPLKYATGKPPNIKHLLVVDDADKAFFQTLSALVAPLRGSFLDITLVGAPSDNSELDLARFLPEETTLRYLDRAQLPLTLQQSGSDFDYVLLSRRSWQSELAPLLAQLNCPLIVTGN